MDVALAVDGGVVDERVPCIRREFRQLVREFLEGLEEGLVVPALDLCILYLCYDGFETSLGLVEPLGQTFRFWYSVWSRATWAFS